MVKETQLLSNYVKKYKNLTSNERNSNKTVERYHFTHMRLAKHRKSDNMRMCENRNSLARLMEM